VNARTGRVKSILRKKGDVYNLIRWFEKNRKRGKEERNKREKKTGCKKDIRTRQQDRLFSVRKREVLIN
jgi:type IV secretory pathway TrbF-like protein